MVTVGLGRGPVGCGRLRGCHRQAKRMTIFVKGPREEILMRTEDGFGCSIWRFGLERENLGTEMDVLFRLFEILDLEHVNL